MPLIQNQKGSWFGLPDFGITEKLQSTFKPNSALTAQNGSNLIGGSKAYSGGSVPTTAIPVSGQVAGANTDFGQQLGLQVAGGTGGSTSRGTGAQAPVSAPVNTRGITDQLNVGNNQIDTDYNSYISDLNAQEGQYRGEAANAESAVQTAASRARGQLTQEKTAREQGLSDYETQANKTYSSSTQQARDLYRQIQQQNIAQLSAQGLSSSSVSEALAEKLGVETARRITTAATSLDDVVMNINKERKSLGDYYQTKLTELEQDVTAQVGNIRSQLMSGIDAINRARNVAANERANRRQALLVDAQSAISQIQQQAQAYQQSLDTWTQQKVAGLNETVKNLPAIWQNFNAQMQGVTQQYGQDFTLAPQLNTDSNGNIIPTGVSVSKKKTGNENDPLANPFL